MSKDMGNLCVCFASEYWMDIGDLVGFRLGMVNRRFTFLKNPDPSGFLVGLMDPHAGHRIESGKSRNLRTYLDP